MENLIIGSHVSFTKDEQLVGSVKQAISYGANTFMIYTGAPQNTSRNSLNKELIVQGKTLMQQHNIDIKNVVVHAPYIVNLANKTNHDFGINFLVNELKRCDLLGIDKLIIHPGSHVGVGVHTGINNIIEALNKVFLIETNTKVLLETMAGKGSEIGKTFDELKEIIEGVDKKDKLGVCMDTCHINDAGYDIVSFDKVLDEFDNKIGLSKLLCIHINDSKNEINSHKDRHENFGFGNLGYENLMNIIYNERIKNIPKILETPYITLNDISSERIYPPYKFEIEMIKNKKMNHNLIDDVRNYYK